MLKMTFIAAALMLSSFILTSGTTATAGSASEGKVSNAPPNVVYGCAADGGFRCMCGDRFVGCFTSWEACQFVCDPW